MPVTDPIQRERTRPEQREIQADEARALLAENAGPELEFKVFDILEDGRLLFW